MEKKKKKKVKDCKAVPLISLPENWHEYILNYNIKNVSHLHQNTLLEMSIFDIIHILTEADFILTSHIQWEWSAAKGKGGKQEKQQIDLEFPLPK